MIRHRRHHAADLDNGMVSERIRAGGVQAGIDLVAIDADGNVRTSLAPRRVDLAFLASLQTAAPGAAVGPHHRWVSASNGARWLNHEHEGLLVFERSVAEAVDGSQQVDCAGALRACGNDLREFCSLLCRSATAASGCDRTMVYRFDDACGAEVVADHVPGNPAACPGRRYPPADIPYSMRDLLPAFGARSVFGLSRPGSDIRELPRADAAPDQAGRPIDTSLCVGHPVSPLDIDYLHRTGSAGFAICPLVPNRGPWGLLCLHFHRERAASCREFAMLQKLSVDASAAIATLLDSAAQAHRADDPRTCFGAGDTDSPD